MMDFVMLGALVLGGAFLWVNKDNLPCMFNPNDPSCGGITGPDCTLEPDAAGCGGGTGSGGADCGKLCRDKKCTDYKKSCTQGCKYCCGSGPNSPYCPGQAGSQCKSLCDTGRCTTFAGQCAGTCYRTGCSKCDASLQSLKISIIAGMKAMGFSAAGTGCGGTVGCAQTCRMCRRCPDGHTYCTSALSLGAYPNKTAMLNALVASFNKLHPQGCSSSGGCTKQCGGGYALNKGSCTCVCNTSCYGGSCGRNCGASNQCLLKSNTTCGCINTGSQGGCPSGQVRYRTSTGVCGCKVSSTPCSTCRGGACKGLTGSSCTSCCNAGSGSGCPGSMYTNCTWDCNGKYCWKSKCGGITVTYCTGSGNTAWSRSYGCSQAQKNFLARCAAYTRAIIPEEPYPRVAGSYAGQAGPFGDYRYVQTMRLPPPMFAGRTRR